MAKKSKFNEETSLCECDTKKSRGYARYYDAPDGCDIPTKMMVASRYGAVAGLIFSSFDILMYSHAHGFPRMMGRYMYHTIPITLMGATFAAVSNAAHIMRDKDDVLNYFLGGLACGPIVAAYVGSMHGLVVGGLALGAIGVVKKTAVDNDVTLIPDIVPHMGSVNSWRHDYTLMADPKPDVLKACQLSGRTSTIGRP
ncbi:NADH dehydrogenase [ubiquinone] 1 alpha subcomplex subunit 11-like [Hyposmocoma kahamanoa]|uniref:NADH dehydrogenase [ubiquinone] 1 alpha subcomplex subunit 11-like n=1 Tax=Hyposmocoma kahamanoa TaxID=1477025 RepID=UPI000E6D9752|nr:NADH dehydrogenase [ubiquinone] 1 alpha subcomplex subunit 11-like [Hyposmocoma kahamanoa]